MIKVGTTLGEILVDKKKISREQLEEAVERQRESGEFLGQALIKMGYVSEEDVTDALVEQRGLERIDLSLVEISQEVLGQVSSDIAQFYSIVPISKTDGLLTVAMANPLNISVLDDLRTVLGCDVKGVFATQSQVLATINKFYGYKEESASSLMEELVLEVGDKINALVGMSEREEIADASNLIALAHEPPVIKLINLVLLQSIQSQASDLHFEAFEDDYQIRQRIDGICYIVSKPPKQFHLAVSSRIKVMANLDIAERRLPQDGRIQLSLGGKEVDLRVNILPTMFGDSVVIRILDRSAVMISFDALGLDPRTGKILGQLIRRPNGIILVTGPTGCGKTTTLYACLNEINDPGYKLITTEDPVEYHVYGIIQVQIHDKIGLTFARCLRSMLRQDPDIIMVGEIRDLPTAEMAIESSLTGHLVFSTLHTNDAPSTITRLIDMHVEPFLLTSTIEAIVAQRLIRKLCRYCKEPHEPSEHELSKVGLTKKDIEGKTIYRAKGCPDCNGIGYKGREGIFELMTLNDEIRDLVLQRAPTVDIRNAAKKAGMVTLREGGIEKVFLGVTTLEEVFAVTET